MNDSELRRAYATCVEYLRGGESYAATVPSTLDVRIALGRMRIIADREDVVVRCHALSLPLCDE